MITLASPGCQRLLQQLSCERTVTFSLEPNASNAHHLPPPPPPFSVRQRASLPEHKMAGTLSSHADYLEREFAKAEGGITLTPAQFDETPGLRRWWHRGRRRRQLAAPAGAAICASLHPHVDCFALSRNQRCGPCMGQARCWPTLTVPNLTTCAPLPHCPGCCRASRPCCWPGMRGRCAARSCSGCSSVGCSGVRPRCGHGMPLLQRRCSCRLPQ